MLTKEQKLEEQRLDEIFEKKIMNSIKCSVCGTKDISKFHPNSIIGYRIAKGLMRNGATHAEANYFDFDNFRCKMCYAKMIKKQNEEARIMRKYK
jgi:hypothetical protein